MLSVHLHADRPANQMTAGVRCALGDLWLQGCLRRFELHRASILLLASSPVFASETLTVQAVAEGETEGIACRCIIVSDARSRPYRLYVGREDGLLYRVSSSVSEGGISDEIHRNIRTDHAIDDTNFRGP